jgi:hypothetical protein
VRVACNLTLESSFNSSIGPTVGSTFGSITRATPSGCTGGEASFLSPPWSLTFSSYSGRQPEGMVGYNTTMNGVSLSLRSGLLSCLYRGNLETPFALSGSNPYPVGTARVLNLFPLSLVSGGGCASGAFAEGRFALARASDFSEIPGLALRAEPMTLSRALAMGGAPVRFFNDSETQSVRVDAILSTSNRWGGTWSGCVTTIMPMRSCEITVTANADAPDALLRLNNSLSGLVGQLSMTAN